MDIFLLVVTVIIFFVLIVMGGYLIVYFSHRDDKNDAYFPKFVVLFGFVLCGSVVLLLPLDVANNDGYAGCAGYDTALCGGLNMVLFWDIVYISVWVWLVFLIPFSTFYYEADDGTLMAGTSSSKKERGNSRLVEALKYEVAVVVVVGALFGVAYALLKETSIPVRDYDGPTLAEVVSLTNHTTSLRLDANGTIVAFSTNDLPDTNAGDAAVAALAAPLAVRRIVMDVGLVTFFAAGLAFVGWIFFAVFAGVGMAALPLDLLLVYRDRPRHMDAVEMADARTTIQNRVNELVDVGEMIKIDRDGRKTDAEGSGGAKGFLGGLFGGGGGGGSTGKTTTRAERKEAKQTLVKFKQAVYMLEKDVEDFKNCSTEYNKYNPIIPYASLLGGVLSIILSIFWVLQTALYVLPETPIHPLLNSYFTWFDSWFPLFGVLSVTIFSFYLLLCAVKGCFKFGLRFLFFTIHPMTPGRTYMSSFLFNTALVLLCSVPTVQFSTYAFAAYARNSTALQVFGTQIRYLKFFGLFFEKNIFVYALLVVFGLTSLYLVAKPRDTAADATILRDRLRSRRS